MKHMTKPVKQIAIAYSVLLAAAVFLFAFGVGREFPRALLMAVIVMLDLAATFVVLQRKSLISYALSVIPAVAMWAFLCSRRILFLVISLVVSIILFLIYRGRLPDTRRTTDGWIGMLIITCISSLTPFIIIAAAQ